MNCQAIRNQILALPDPRELSPALREHVLNCAGCRPWARLASRLEVLLEQLPVPPAPSEKKETLLGELMAVEPVIQPMATPATRPGFGRVAANLLRRNAAFVAGLAAALLVAIGLYWVVGGRTPGTRETAKTHKHPLLEKLVARDVALARADTATKKLEELNGMADDIASDTRGMARLASGAELKQMAGWYEKVVKEGLVPQAGNLPTQMPAAEKVRVLDALAAKLEADATETEKIARESPPDAQPALARMANTAREGKMSLQATARGSK